MGFWVWRHVSPNIRWQSDNLTNTLKGKYIMIMLISFRENVIILYKFNLKCSLPKARFYWSVGYILPVSSPPSPPKKNKYARHDIAGKLKKVMINTNNLIHIPCIINTRFISFTYVVVSLIPLHCEVYLIQPFVITFVNDLLYVVQ